MVASKLVQVNSFSFLAELHPSKKIDHLIEFFHAKKISYGQLAFRVRFEDENFSALGQVNSKSRPLFGNHFYSLLV